MSDRYLTRAQLEIINKRTLRYPLQVAEKDYFLALAVQKIARSSLEKELVFKGGTAIPTTAISPNTASRRTWILPAWIPRSPQKKFNLRLNPMAYSKRRKSSHQTSPSRSSACSIKGCLDSLATSRSRWTFNRTSFCQQNP
jgi:hypothetical protein